MYASLWFTKRLSHPAAYAISRKKKGYMGTCTWLNRQASRFVHSSVKMNVYLLFGSGRSIVSLLL
jgi:hypothetical protein